MIDPMSEETIPLTEASPIVPGRPHLTTIWRWCRQGVRGVRLESVVIGGRRYTSREAIRRFFDRLNENTIAS